MSAENKTWIFIRHNSIIYFEFYKFLVETNIDFCFEISVISFFLNYFMCKLIKYIVFFFNVEFFALLFILKNCLIEN